MSTILAGVIFAVITAIGISIILIAKAKSDKRSAEEWAANPLNPASVNFDPAKYAVWQEEQRLANIAAAEEEARLAAEAELEAQKSNY